MREGGSHRQRMTGSGVSGAGAWALVSPAGRGMAWWAETSQMIVLSHPGDRPVALSQSLH